MQQRPPEFADLLKALNEGGVRYVVVGGFAAVLHGAFTVTFDLDFATSTDSENASALVRALRPYHPYPPQYGSPKAFVWDERSVVGAVASLATDAGPIDILYVQPGVPSFEALWDRAEVRVLAGLEIRVACLDDLIAMKEVAGREKDVEHLRHLYAARDTSSERS